MGREVKLWVILRDLALFFKKGFNARLEEAFCKAVKMANEINGNEINGQEVFGETVGGVCGACHWFRGWDDTIHGVCFFPEAAPGHVTRRSLPCPRAKLK